MARLTPIERAIAGPPADRRQVYADKMRDKGFTRVTALIHADDAALVYKLAKLLRDEPDARSRIMHFLADIIGEGDGTERPQRSEDAPLRRPRRRSSQGQ